MELEEVKDYMRDMFDGETAEEVITVAELVQVMVEGGTPVSADDVDAACDLLCFDGMLERADKGHPEAFKHAYKTRSEYEERKDAKFAEFFAGAVAEHELKRIGGKK